VTTTSILFSFHPFANIWSAMFKLHAICFTANKKAHYLAIDRTDGFQIKNDVAVVCLELKKPSQLGYRRFFDSATQDEHCESPSCFGLNPESHRSGPLGVNRSRVVLHCIAFDPSSGHL